MTGQIPYVSRPQVEEFLNAFAVALEQPSQHPLVFHVWGIGGVGKSTLTRKVKEAHQSNAQLAEVYFGMTEGIEAPIPLMAKLYKQLPDGNSWEDPFLDQYELYWETIHKLETEAASGRGTVGEEQAKQVKDLLKLGVDIAGGLFLSEPAKKMTETVVERGMNATIAGLSLKDNVQQFLQQHKATRRNKQLQELMLNPLARLTEAFVVGLRQRAEQKPIILVLDTYEKASSEIDTWLWRTLLANTILQPHAIRLVVAGQRCVLKTEGWSKLHQDRNLVYERDLNRFNLEQTRLYLNYIGIEAEDTVQQIFSITKGLPYYLNWIREERIKGRELDFSQGNEQIANLLLQGLNPTQKRVVRIAACCHWFDCKLIQYLMEHQGLDFATAADERLDCYGWLTQQTFVKLARNYYRFDDVARDVFRLSLWQDDREVFHQVHHGLGGHFKAESDREVSPDSPPPAQYDNPEWRKLRAEFLYHLLFSRNADEQHQFRSHLLEAHYLRQDEVVQLPLQAISTEMELASHKLLPHSTRDFLARIRPAIEHSWEKLDEIPRYTFEQILNRFSKSKEEMDTAIQVCLKPIEPLSPLAKFAALFYESRRCPKNQSLGWLLQAKEQAKRITSSSAPEFSSDLFLWRIGNALFKLGCYEEAIDSYNIAREIKPDDPVAWGVRGVTLLQLGRKEEAIASCNEALKHKPDYYAAYLIQGVTFAELEGRDEAAVTSYSKALELNPDYQPAWYCKGLVLMRLEQFNQAIDSFNRALDLKPDDAGILYNQSCCYGLQGNIEAALQVLQQAIDLDAKSREMAKTDSDFDNIRDNEQFQALLQG